MSKARLNSVHNKYAKATSPLAASELLPKVRLVGNQPYQRCNLNYCVIIIVKIEHLNRTFKSYKNNEAIIIYVFYSLFTQYECSTSSFKVMVQVRVINLFRV